MCVLLPNPPFLPSKKCVVLDESGHGSQGGMLTMPLDGKLEGNLPFILIIGWMGEHSLFSGHEQRNFPRVFFFAFLTLIGLEAYPCDPAGSTCHNKSKNMTEMFSLARPISVKHQCGGSRSLMILLYLFPENVTLLQAHSLPGCSSDSL